MTSVATRPAPTLEVMSDSVNGTWLATAQILLTYVDGEATKNNFKLAKQRRPDAWCVQTTVEGQPGVAVFDIEQGDGTIAEGVRWSAKELRQGRRPTLYGGGWTRSLLVPALATEGLKLGFTGHVDYLLANPNGKPPTLEELILSDDIGAQYYWGPWRGPDSYDLSVVRSDWHALLVGDPE